MPEPGLQSWWMCGSVCKIGSGRPLPLFPTRHKSTIFSPIVRLKPGAPAPAASEAVDASVPPVVPVDLHATETGEKGRGWTETWIGVLLMALGIVCVLSSSRALREAVLLRH